MICLVSIGSTTGLASGQWPNSWSCSSSQCTGVYSSSGGQQSYSVGIPFANVAPSTEFQSANEEFTEFEPNALNCDVDGKAVEAAIGIKKTIDTDGLGNNTKNQTEYGTVLADKGSGVQAGSIVQGQSYNQSAQPSVNLTPPRNSIGATNAQVVGIVHSHPYSGSSTIDNANKRPSPADWATADQLVAQGANAFRLTLYIIDRWGNVWAYAYKGPSQRTSNFPPARNLSTACQ